MKVLLYFENEELIRQSGVGRALVHQKSALTQAGVDFTLDPRDKDYDILHINTVGANSLFMVHKARKMGKKVIYHAHSTEEDFRNSFIFSNAISPVFKKYLVTLYKSADMLITPTPYSRSILQSYGLKQEIRVISNGINLEKYKKDEEKAKKFREAFGLAEDEKYVFGAGLLFHRKGIPDFVEVAKMLPDCKFFWFGDISRIVIPRDINRIVDNPPGNVVFPGYISGDMIEGAYSGASCFFFPTNEETEGIVVLEALAEECPLVVRDIGAFDPWLQDGYNCYKAKDNKGFAARIDAILKGTAKDTTYNGLQTAKERSVDNIGEQLKAAYTRVLEL